MRLCRLLCTMGLGLLCATAVCHAQTTIPTTGDLALDMRSRLAAVGPSGSDLHATSLRLKTGLAPDLNLEVYGIHQYGAYTVQQAQVSKEWGSQRLQLGIIRLPFGIYDYRETYASGLIDYPMPRVDYAYNSVDWGVPGVQWTGGSPQLQVEAAAFGGRSYGVWGNRNTTGGGALRVQTYTGGLILGVSRWDGYENPLPTGGKNEAVHLTGIDLRCTQPHWLFRGEYLAGKLAGDQMRGWYLDAYYRLPKYEQWTLVARLEQLHPEASGPTGKQVTLGARYVLSREWILALNWRRNNGAASYDASWTPYAIKRGDLFFQIYRKISL